MIVHRLISLMEKSKNLVNYSSCDLPNCCRPILSQLTGFPAVGKNDQELLVVRREEMQLLLVLACLECFLDVQNN